MRRWHERNINETNGRPAPPPFNTMTDDEILEFVNREIAAYRQEARMRNKDNKTG
jgi:hypothetical protein